MDATALRWVMGIIGVVCLLGIYLYSLYQNKLRRQAAVKTFTHEDMESGFIEDEALRQELSSINAMLDDEVDVSHISDIKINSEINTNEAQDEQAQEEADLEVEWVLPREVCELLPDYRVVHVLKSSDNRLLTAEEITHAMAHTGFVLNEQFRYLPEDYPQAQFQLLNLTASGSFQALDQPSDNAQGIVCCINLKECNLPAECYELMLKKIDELVRILDLKVYSHEQELLTLQHVTDVRKKLIELSASEVEGETDRVK